MPPASVIVPLHNEVRCGAGQGSGVTCMVLVLPSGCGADLPGRGRSPCSGVAGGLSAAACCFSSAASCFSGALGFGSADVFSSFSAETEQQRQRHAPSRVLYRLA